MLQGVLKFVNQFQLYIIAALVLVTTVTSVGWYVTDLKLDKAKQELVTFQETVKSAQKEAELKAVKAKAEQEKKDEIRREEADTLTTDLKSKYSALLVRYAEAQRKASRANLSSPSKASEGIDGPGGDTELPAGAVNLPETLTIPYKDAQICADNTARLEAAHEWATTK